MYYGLKWLMVNILATFDLVLLARIAQLVEQRTFMRQVPGSIPAPDSSWLGVDSALHPSVGRLN